MSWLGMFSRFQQCCPQGWELTRAVSEGVTSNIEWHLARCVRCAAEYQALRTLVVKAAAAFPTPQKMTRDSREVIGVNLRTAESPSRSSSRRRSWLWLAPAAALVVGVALWGGKIKLISRPGPAIAPAPTLQSRASIRAVGRARFARVRLLPDEVVQLDEGQVELEVAPLGMNERFRVLTDDGQVEVRGTRFTVTASERHLAAVHVSHGRVEVRSSGGALAILDAGDDWIREVPPGAGPSGMPSIQDSIRPSPSIGPKGSRSHRGLPDASQVGEAAMARPMASATTGRRGSGSDGSASFGHAWSLLRDGDSKGAATEFGKLERLAQGRDIEEDVLYWQAVATGRAGDAGGARSLFEGFLTRFPSGVRSGEAAATLGWLWLDAGQVQNARRCFERAVLDASPRVRASAEEGLRRTQAKDE